MLAPIVVGLVSESALDAMMNPAIVPKKYAFNTSWADKAEHAAYTVQRSLMHGWFKRQINVERRGTCFADSTLDTLVKVRSSTDEPSSLDRCRHMTRELDGVWV